MTSGILKVVQEHQADIIYVEEVNRGISRISQKSLDALHFFVLQGLAVSKTSGKLRYIDSDGNSGWRKILNLRLNEAQKKANKKRKKGKKLTKKHLAADYVNAKHGTAFDVDLRKTDSDLADAVGIGCAVYQAGLLDFEVS